MIDSSIVEEIWSNPRIDQDYANRLRQLCQSANQVDAGANNLALLPMLFCEAHGGYKQQAIPIVTVWNIFRHAARLLDDIEDGHVALSERAALDLNISTGLIFTAGYILGDLETDGIPAAVAGEIRQAFYIALLQTCGGQHGDLLSSPPSLEKSWQIVGDKSGVGLGLVCWAGGRLACSDKDKLELYRQFGYNLGLLDQIQDDLTDLSATEDLGKPSRHSLPVAYALTVLPSTEKKILLSLLNTVQTMPTNEETARRLIMKSGAAVYLITQASFYHKQAEQLLNKMTLPAEIKERLQPLLKQFYLR
jgi:geranylgeranyl pyrophosphate synthase